MIKGDTRLTTPNPHRGDISVDILKKILRRPDISYEEWDSAK